MNKTRIRTSLSPIELFDIFNENLLRYLPQNGEHKEVLTRIRQGIESSQIHTGL